MEYNISKLFNNIVNRSSHINSNLPGTNLVCNGIGMIAFEMTDSIIASAIFSITTNIFFSIISLIGNSLTIYVIAFRLGFMSFAFRGIFMISVFSIFYSCVPQVLFTITRFHDLANYHNCQLKLIADALTYTGQAGLYATITALSIDRYIAVVYHQYYGMIKVHYIYATISIITAIIWIPLIIISFLKKVSHATFKVMVSSYLLLHFSVIAFTYLKVILKLAKHNKNRVQHLEASVHEDEMHRKRKEEERRQNSVLFIIGFHALSLLGKAACFSVRVGIPNNYELEYYCQRSTQFLLTIDAALYPFLYAWRIDTLRKEMLRILRGKLCFSATVEVEQNA